MLQILKDIQLVNKSFESNEANPTKFLKDLLLLIKSLVKKVVIPTFRIDSLEANIEEVLDPKSFLGYEFEKEVEVLRARLHFAR